MSYSIGTKIRFTATFRIEATQALVDPTTVTFRFRNPSGTETSYVYGVNVELVRDSLGVFHVDLTPNASGSWYRRWIGTGAAAVAKESSFAVDKTFFTTP